MEKMTGATPVYILSGFLGSGKTTLLQRLLAYWKKENLRPAVIMNEMGEINLDGMLVGEEVPMAEMLGGCICCTFRGDLSVQLYELITQEHPDLVVIEATGAANPMDMFDAVSEASMYLKLDIRPMITVVDAAHLAELYASQQGKTYRLMLEQIRCGSELILNKIDRLAFEQQQEMKDLLVRLNPYARITPAIRCEVDPLLLLKSNKQAGMPAKRVSNDEPVRSEHPQGHNHEHQHEHNHDHSHDHAHDHSLHEHVTVYTHYLSGPIDSRAFEEFIKELPREVYRGKGIVHFSDTSGRFLFQYAYRETDYMKITPQGNVPDAVVLIGEHFDKQEIAARLKALEGVPAGSDGGE